MSDRRLLVVDDQPDFANVVRRLGEHQEYVVETLSDSRGFEEAYHRFDPSVIVLDIFMPEIDGIEIIRWLAESGNRTPVILTTGYDVHFAEAARLLGSLGGGFSITTLEKPFGLAAMAAALEGRG